MDLGLQDRCFLVTGGSDGLGLAAARALVAEGARVVLAARRQEAIDEAVATLGGAAVGLAADLADPTAPERLTAAALARFGRLDGALISVGGPPPGSVMTVTDEAWRTGFETVFLGALRVARATATSATPGRNLPAGHGPAIALVLSTSARSPITGLSISNGLRPGLMMLVKDLADELGPRGIRVNAILPGRIATERLFALDSRAGNPETVRRRQQALIPLGRYGEPDEFGRLAAFLLSPAASYLTGTGITLDGGATRTP